ncbi:MAG: ABC transporter substrate-binding protein [Lachnospiraceae bacterium]|nr:ABC transporter substrate-binding protein [Lachnospiraceae bacterium]
MIKRFYSMILIIAITALLICGCGPVSRDVNSKGEEVIKLRVVTYDNGSVPLDAKEVIAAANEVSREKIGVEVELEFQSKEKINLMMASGEYYDMVFTNSWINSFDKNASAGLYYDITDAVKEVTPDLYDSIGEYWDCAKINGRIYGIPVLKDMGSENMYRLNADYFEGEKGMKIPERMTFGDIEPYLKAYKEDHPAAYPLAMDKSGLPGFSNFLERIVETVVVIPYDQEKPEAIAFWDDEEVMNRFRLLHKWYKAGYIQPDAATIDSTAADKSIPVRPGVAWKGYMGYSNPDDWGFNVKISRYDGPYLSRQSEQGAMTAICAGCDEEHAKACLRYLELLATDRKFRDILGYGIEGKHFNYTENGTVLRTDIGSERYNTKLYQTGSVVNASVESISPKILADPDQWTQVYENYRENGIFSKTKDFAYDPTPKEDIITAINAIYNDYASELRTGTSDPDKVVPEMKKRMEAAGLDELVEDIQEKLEESLAK